jgi:hypothetical protein
VALAAFAAPAPAMAAPPPAAGSATFALTATGTPGAVRLRGAPGATLRGSVLVRNLSRRPTTVRLQPADIRNATSGDADYVTSRLSAAGRWVRLAATTVRLMPKAARKVAFTVRIPSTTRGASHYAGIVALDPTQVTATTRPGTKRKDTSFTIARINRQALPLTVRLPGPLTRKLTLRSIKIAVEPAGAGLVLGLRPGGTILTRSAPVKLRVSRGPRTILRHSSTLGQLFPNDSFDFRIAWNGRPTEGSYRVRGVIRPEAAAPVYFDQMLRFTPAKLKELERETPAVAALQAPDPGLPMWVWLALGGGGLALLGLLALVWRLARRRSDDPPAARPVPGTG